jgi:serine/threonine protein kinase
MDDLNVIEYDYSLDMWSLGCMFASMVRFFPALYAGLYVNAELTLFPCRYRYSGKNLSSTDTTTAIVRLPASFFLVYVVYIVRRLIIPSRKIELVKITKVLGTEDLYAYLEASFICVPE